MHNKILTKGPNGLIAQQYSWSCVKIYKVLLVIIWKQNKRIKGVKFYKIFLEEKVDL